MIILEIMVSIVLGVFLNRKLLFFCPEVFHGIKDLLIGWIESNLTNMFTDANEKVGTIAAEVGQTQSGWNGSIYQMIRGLSENVIAPMGEA